jgi:hypothetical protein
VIATDDGVVAVTAPRAVRRVLSVPADALAACGADVLALADDGVYRWAMGADAERLGERPPARALACAGAASPRLLAAGVGLWTSDDGRAWHEEALGLGRSYAGVAASGGRRWLAADDGLFASPEPAAAEAVAPPAPLAALAPPVRPPTWTWLLPRVSVSFDGWSESRVRSGWRLWLVVTLTLGRRAPLGALAGPEVLE